MSQVSTSNLPNSLDLSGHDDISLSVPLIEAQRLDGHRCLTPPPHIADRFYRPSQARRKQSAASSRRNSLSSAHSRCLSAHGSMPQSKYVAQHLRRVSFLEDRKARLADRAAHAEKVRLRAALAKAAQRDASLSNERALAAQQARERNLAEIAATCAEEVKRAKAVAELIREKHESKMTQMRVQMEERMAEAERRREELRSRSTLRRHRAMSAGARRPDIFHPFLPRLSEHSPSRCPALIVATAASMIQRCWRATLRRRAVRDFSALGLTIDGVRDTSFDDVTALLAQERVLLATARLLRLCGLCEDGGDSVQEMVAVRTFLSAYLILGHPTAVLSNNLYQAEQEQDLVNKARDLLISFESIYSRLTAVNRFSLPPSVIRLLPEAYAAFHSAFVTWKSHDSNTLIELLLMQYVELDAIWLSVKESGDKVSEEHYRHTLKESQLTLLVRIKRLAGDKAKGLVATAVRRARKARVANKPPPFPSANMTPRASGPGPADTLRQTLAPALSPSLASSPTPAVPLSASVSSSNLDSSTRLGPTNAGALTTDLQSLLPDNRIVLHDLAVNQSYVLSVQTFKAHHSLLPKAILAQMRADGQDMITEHSFRLFLVLADIIRDKLQRIVLNGSYMHNMIGEVLDPQLAESQFRVGSFSYEKYFSTVASLLPQLCCPFRDAEILDLAKTRLHEGDLVDRAEALIDCINTMLCDYVNYLMRFASPILIEQAPAYEAKAFARDVASMGVATDSAGRIILPAAEAAWLTARSTVLADTSRRDLEAASPSAVPASGAVRRLGDKIYAQMIVDVFTQPLPVAAAKVPEMLRLDEARVTHISDEVQRLVTAGAVLLQCKNLLKRDVRLPWKPEAARITALLAAAEPGCAAAAIDGIMAALEAGRAMPVATRAHLRALVAALLAASHDPSSASRDPTEPVLRLLLTRLRRHLAAALVPSASATDQLREAAAASDRLSRLGLCEFADRVRAVADELARIAKADRDAHGSWWELVAQRLGHDAPPS